MAGKAASLDAARLAGVSRSAVSRFSTPGTSVPPRTAAQIKAASERLGQPRAVAPFCGFDGVGPALHFAGQGSGRMARPLFAEMPGLVIAVAAGWLMLRLGSGLQGLFVALAGRLVADGTSLAATLRRPRNPPRTATPTGFPGSLSRSREGHP